MFIDEKKIKANGHPHPSSNGYTTDACVVSFSFNMFNDGENLLQIQPSDTTDIMQSNIDNDV